VGEIGHDGHDRGELGGIWVHGRSMALIRRVTLGPSGSVALC
jgi:hypothetical protein